MVTLLSLVSISSISEKLEETPLLHQGKEFKDKELRRRRCFSLLILTVALTLILLTGVLCLTVTQLWPEQPALQSPNLLLSENTTVLLSNCSINEHGVVNITEVVLQEDSFHWNNFAAVPSSKLVSHRISAKEHHVIVPISDNAVTLNQRYVYMLIGSELNYTICIGNATEPSDSTFYAFNKEESYNNYLSSLSLGTPNSIFSQLIPIGGENSIKCTSFTFDANATSYYFFALKAKYANTRVKYNLSASINTLFFEDYISSEEYSTCRINDPKSHMSCSLEVESGDWSILGFSEISYSFNSHLNHVQVTVEQKLSSSALHYELAVMYYGSITVISICVLFMLVALAVFIISSKKYY